MPKANLAIFGIIGKNFFMIFFLLFNTLTWYYMTWTTMNSLLGKLYENDLQFVVIWAVYYVAVMGSGIIGSIVSNKLRTLHFLYMWMFLGMLSSLLLPLITSANLTNALIVSLSLGISFGLGMPSCFTYFADFTNFENRGRTAGVIFLVTNLASPVFAISALMLDLVTISIVLAVWRGLGLVLFLALKVPKTVSAMRRNVSFWSIFENSAFILYLAPWLMFCFINGFEKIILNQILQPDFYSSMQVMEAIIGSLFALVGGWLCDLIGRKRVVIYGFATVGVAYAIIGIFQTTISWYFYFVIDAIAAGMLWVAFILVLWGDLSKIGGREKYYAIGNIPFFLAPLVQVFLAPFVSFPAYAAFSLASFFLFVAVLPLVYAPETLPERKIELRRLRKYVEKAKKVRERYSESKEN